MQANPDAIVHSRLTPSGARGAQPEASETGSRLHSPASHFHDPGLPGDGRRQRPRRPSAHAPLHAAGLWLCCLLTPGLHAATSPGPEAAAPPPTNSTPRLPYVYTEWQQFTTRDGLPNDHIFAVKVAGPHVWIGTENGLARYDKATGTFKTWTEKEGLPWRVVSWIDVHPKTGEVWLALFGGGLARFSAGRFDHFHQLNSGLVNDVVYGVCIENDNVWCATTAGASRYNTLKDKWDIYTEKNAPMEEIWNYGACYDAGKVYLGVWGSGVLEFDIATERWKDYLDPDGEMEIDLYRDDGIVHVITTGVSAIDGILWVTTYFGACRYDGRHWRGYFAHDCGIPSDFNNAVKGRSAHEAWFCTDKGLGVIADFDTDTWVKYVTDGDNHGGAAVIQRGTNVIQRVNTGYNLPHNYVLSVDFDGPDAWVGTSKGLARAVGKGYYPRLAPGTETEEKRATPTTD